jgi:hypothetical protein
MFVTQCFKNSLCLGDDVEEMAVQAFSTQRSKEAFDERVLPWATWRDADGPAPSLLKPVVNGLGDELWTAIPSTLTVEQRQRLAARPAHFAIRQLC